MVKQVKIFHRYESVHYPPKRGLIREMMLTDDEEHHPFIRAKRGRELLLRVSCHWCCNVDKEFYLHHSRRDLKSWKSRCKKRHQWEPHRHTETEYEQTRYYNADKSADALYRVLQNQPGEVLLDTRSDCRLDDAISVLERKDIAKQRSFSWQEWLYPYRWVKLTGKRLYQAHETDPFDDLSPESDRHGYENRRRHTGKLPRRTWIFDHWEYDKTPRRRSAGINFPHWKWSCKEKQKPRLSPQDIFENYYHSLPHNIRRHWQYKQWKTVITADSARRTSRYLELLDLALKNRLEVMFSTYDPQNNPYAEFFWNMAGEEWCPVRPSASEARLPHGRAQFETWATQTFFRFPLPRWASHLLFTQCSHKDADGLRKWSEGVSPRLLWNLSKKENGLFHTMPGMIPTLRYALIVSACRAKGCGTALARTIAGAFQEHLDRNALYDTLLSQSRYLGEWFARIGDDAMPHVHDLIDFLFAEHFIHERVSLAHRTLKSLTAEMDQWHERLAEAEAAKNCWTPHGLSHYLPEDEVKFEELCSARRLQREGHEQHNCVASYLKKCMEGRSSIISMRQLFGGARATLEVSLSQKAVIQAKGPYNETPDSRSSRFIRRYAREKELAVNCRLCA